jgi:hypothetical protein
MVLDGFGERMMLMLRVALLSAKKPYSYTRLEDCRKTNEWRTW